MHLSGSQELFILLLFKAEAVLFRRNSLSDQKKDCKSTAVTDSFCQVFRHRKTVSFVNTVRHLVKKKKKKEEIETKPSKSGT